MELSTTQIYTQVSIRKLQVVHALTHPTAKLERHEAAGDELVSTALARPELAKTTADPGELLARLAAEHDEETAEDEHALRHSG